MTGPAIDRAIAELLTSLGVRANPPIDLDALANLFGIEAIEEASMIEDGRLEVERNHIRLLVRPDLSPARRRFTIAHEFGHLLLVDGNQRAVARRLRAASSDTERLCDDVAASLLMPAEWVKRRFASRARNLSSIRQLAHTSGTSMSAATARLAEVLDWKMALLRWRNERDKWRFIAGAGIPPRLHGQIRSAPATSSVLDAIQKRTRRDTRASLPLLLGDQVVDIDAQVSVRGPSAIVLAGLGSIGSRLNRVRVKTSQ